MLILNIWNILLKDSINFSLEFIFFSELIALFKVFSSIKIFAFSGIL